MCSRRRPRSSSSLPVEKKIIKIIVRRGEEKERKLWTTERSALTGAMTAIIKTIVGVGGVKSLTAGVIMVVKVLDIMEMLAMMETMECKDFVKAQGRLRNAGEGRGEGRIMAIMAEARLMVSPAMDTRVFHQTNQ